MKLEYKFIVAYSILSVVFLLVSKFIFELLSMEIFAYFLSFYLILSSICLIFYPIVKRAVNAFTRNAGLGMVIDLVFFLAVINGITYYFGGSFVTVDLLKDVFNNSEFYFNTLGVHLILLLSYSITYILFYKKIRHAANGTKG